MEQLQLTSREVPLHLLRREHGAWHNPRTQSGLSDKDLDALADDILARGLQDPLTVQRVLVNGESVDVVTDGQRRELALERLVKRGKIKSDFLVKVVDRTEEPIDLTIDEADKILLDMLATQVQRKELSSYELVMAAETLRKRNRTMEDVADAIGMSSTWVSKMLKALGNASPILLLKWQKGQITDEQFKDLASLKDMSEQEEGAAEAIEAKKAGSPRGEARAAVKERKERAEKSKRVTNGHNKEKIVKGPQAELFSEGKKTPKPPSKAVLEEIVAMADKKPPTSDYVKGIVDAVNWQLGKMTDEDFRKPWKQYLARVEGKVAKKAKPSKAKKKPSKKKR